MCGLKLPSGAPHTVHTQKLGRSETRSGGGIELGSSCVQREQQDDFFSLSVPLRSKLLSSSPT